MVIRSFQEEHKCRTQHAVCVMLLLLVLVFLTRLPSAHTHTYHEDYTVRRYNTPTMLDVHIVSTIISHSDQRTVVNCARVCRLWAEIALDNIWMVMDSLKPLLEILCPLLETKDEQGREVMVGVHLWSTGLITN